MKIKFKLYSVEESFLDDCTDVCGTSYIFLTAEERDTKFLQRVIEIKKYCFETYGKTVEELKKDGEARLEITSDTWFLEINKGACIDQVKLNKTEQILEGNLDENTVWEIGGIK